MVRMAERAVNMRWKDFLKPDLIKIILFVVIYIFSMIFTPFYIDSNIVCITEPCGFLSGTNLAVGFIVSYLVSCFIIFSYRKSSKKK